jgi:hypothetical protein
MRYKRHSAAVATVNRMKGTSYLIADLELKKLASAGKTTPVKV